MLFRKLSCALNTMKNDHRVSSSPPTAPRAAVWLVAAAAAGFPGAGFPGAGLLPGAGAGAGAALASQILETESGSLTTYLAGKAGVQDVRPLPEQRGVHLDGSTRAGVPLGWALAGNPFEAGYRGSSRLGAIAVATGSYHPMAVDLALPTRGPRWVVGRTFNARQDSSGAHDSNGYQGYNWFQVSQPELVLYEGATDDEDVVYLVYGADRYAEFKRTGVSDDTFKGKNGAAGVVEHVSGTPDTYVYHDQNGTRAYFFGGNTSGGRADWQLWKIVDAAGQAAYAGHETTASTAVTSGYTTDGFIAAAWDDAGRKYEYTYSTGAIGGTKRLENVTVLDGSDEIGWVDYSYYGTSESYGSAGDLKLVTVTTPLSDYDPSSHAPGIDTAYFLERKTYYRYYTSAWADSDGSRGHPHAIRYVVEAEGYRRADYDTDGDSALDDGPLTFSEANLKPHASLWFEYESASTERVSKFWSAGDCGCGGGNDGTHTLSYTARSYTQDTGYDTDANAEADWHERTVIGQPDGTYRTQYFDEVDQALSTVTTDADPAGSPTKTWAVRVIRNGDGQVTSVHTPASNSGYTHSTGVLTTDAVDLVRLIERAASGDLKGFAEATLISAGDPGRLSNMSYPTTSPTYMSATSYTDRDLGVGGTAEVTRPYVATRRAYHTAGTAKGTAGNYDETSMSYAYHSATTTDVQYLAVDTLTTTLPKVDSTKNGEGTGANANITKRYLRADGTTSWMQSQVSAAETDETKMVFSYSMLDDKTGQVECSVGDGTDASVQNIPTEDKLGFGATWETNAPALERIIERTFDEVGRVDTTVAPGFDTGNKTTSKMYYSKLKDGRAVTVSIPRVVGSTYHGPASYTVSNLAGRAEFTGTIGIASGGTTTALSGWIDETSDNPEATLHADVDDLASVTVTLYTDAGSRATESRMYYDLTSFPGSEGTNFDATYFAHDDMGRRWRVKAPTGTITRTAFDVLGRVEASYIGTNDSTFGDGEPSGTDNMVKVSEVIYDGGSGGGNGNVTKRTAFVVDGTADRRDTTYEYDWRDRLIVTNNPEAPHSVAKHDNLGRTVAVGLYSSSTGLDTSDDPTSLATNRLALRQTFFDEQGRVWKTQRHKITPSTGADADNLQTLTWYDDEGRAVKVDGERLTKTAYDRLGRMTHSFVLAADNDTTYANATVGASGDITDGDTVLEERQTAYDPDTFRAVMTATISRHYDDKGMGETTGALDSDGDADAMKFTAANITGRIQIIVMWYDKLGRVTTTGRYGTFGGSDFDWSAEAASVPSSSSGTVLVVEQTYDAFGRMNRTDDPNGNATTYGFDDAGRPVRVTANDSVTYISGPTDAFDQVVRTEYADGLRAKLWVDFDGDGVVDSNDQETIYTYGTAGGGAAGDSDIATGYLLQKVQYPDSSGGTDVVTYAYNAQGQRVYMKDQAGNIIESDFDDAGRRTHRRVTALASGFDGAVRRITTAYDGLGRVLTVDQYDNAAVGSGDIVDGVKYNYEAWGNVWLFEQDHNSGVDESGSATDEYEIRGIFEKATGGRNTIRRTRSIYRYNDTEYYDVRYSYLSASDRFDDDASRVTQVRLTDLSNLLVAEYAYNGVGRVIRTDLPEPDMFTDLDGSTARTYDDLDRWNRFASFAWTRDLSTDRDLYSVDVAYNIGGNITRVIDNVQPGWDTAFGIDGLNRVTSVHRGTWNGSEIASATFYEEWTLDLVGNWEIHKLDLDGNGTYTGTGELNDDQTFNNASELTHRDIDDDGLDDLTLAYDATGNLTDDGEDYKYVYDAFGRLVKIEDQSSNTVAKYTYNGLGYRIGWHYDVDGDGTVENTSDDPWYRFVYDTRWRIVSTFRADDTSPKEVFVYHNAGRGGTGASSYFDAIILRDKDANTAWDTASDGTLEDRVYYLQNWQADVVSLIDENATQLEAVRYDAHGVPYGIPAGDVNSDYKTDSSDLSAITSYGGAYDVRYDINLDGTIDSGDTSAIKFLTLGRGTLSEDPTASSGGGHGNRKGAAGKDHDGNLSELIGVRTAVRLADAGRRINRRGPISALTGYAMMSMNKESGHPSGCTGECRPVGEFPGGGTRPGPDPNGGPTAPDGPWSPDTPGGSGDLGDGGEKTDPENGWLAYLVFPVTLSSRLPFDDSSYSILWSANWNLRCSDWGSCVRGTTNARAFDGSIVYGQARSGAPSDGFLQQFEIYPYRTRWTGQPRGAWGCVKAPTFQIQIKCASDGSAKFNPNPGTLAQLGRNVGAQVNPRCGGWGFVTGRGTFFAGWHLAGSENGISATLSSGVKAGHTPRQLAAPTVSLAVSSGPLSLSVSLPLGTPATAIEVSSGIAQHEWECKRRGTHPWSP